MTPGLIAFAHETHCDATAALPYNAAPLSAQIQEPTIMQARATLTAAAVAGFTAVALGAFGAHGLKHILSADMLEVYRTGVLYHLVHAVALLGLGIWLQLKPSRWLRWSANMMLLGLILFSGSLYAMTLSGINMLGIITPFGGVSWLIAWALLLVAAMNLTTQDTH